jgi:hypothetical protein
VTQVIGKRLLHSTGLAQAGLFRGVLGAF